MTLMAEVYAADHFSELKGLIFLAAYGTKDISDSGLQVLGTYGKQKGDGIATISPEKQREDTAEIMVQFIDSSL